MNGYKLDDPFGGTVTTTINTLEIPLNILYKFGKPGVDNFFVGVGPYIADNISGKFKENDNFNGSASTKVNIGTGPNDDLKPFDLGVGIDLGYGVMSGFFLRAHYQYGLANLAPQGNSQNTFNNVNYGLSVGFLFCGNNQHTKTVKNNQ